MWVRWYVLLLVNGMNFLISRLIPETGSFSRLMLVFWKYVILLFLTPFTQLQKKVSLWNYVNLLFLLSFDKSMIKFRSNHALEIIFN